MTTSIRILVFVAVFCVGLQHVADSAHTGTSQMIDQSSSSLAQLRRPRREVYREIKKFQLCCEQTYEEEEEEEEEEDEVVEKCYIQAMNKLGIEERESKAEENTKGPNDGGERERFGNYSVCFVECVFKEFKMADCNGNVIPDEAIKFMDPSTFVESEKLWNGVRNKCFKGIEQNTLCNRAASDYVECVYHFADMYCPAEKQVKDPICDYLRMTLRKKYNVEYTRY